MLRALSVCSVVALILAVPCAEGASIGLFGSSDCSVCNATVPVGIPTQIFIAADNTDTYPLSGVEFRITGLPPGWTALATRAPTVQLVFGDPFSAEGSSVSFYLSQTGTCIPVFSLLITANSVATDVRLRVEKRNPPSNPSFQCPSANVDCPACFTRVCVSGGEMLLNSEIPCSVSVSQEAWSHVKQLYR
jgi:hypothetical protein